MANTIKFDSIENARELGGIICCGKRIRHNRMFRSANLSMASENDLKRLRDEFGVKTVFDLRSEFEYSVNPDKIIEGIDLVYNPVLENTSRSDGKGRESWFHPGEGLTRVQKLIRVASRDGMSTMQERIYDRFVDSDYSRIHYGEFFKNVLNLGGTPFLWHCTFGKDRGGFASVYLLAALGANDECILDDFAESGNFYREDCLSVLSEAKKEGVGDDVLNNLEFLVGLKREYMERSIENINARFGSVLEYVRIALKVNDESIEKLREYYLE